MSNDVVTVRLSQKHAAFLQAYLSVLASTARQAMTRPGLDAERRSALGSRASVLETIEDTLHGALLEGPQEKRKATPRTETRRAPQNIDRLSAA